jgi:hypothetical protein
LPMNPVFAGATLHFCGFGWCVLVSAPQAHMWLASTIAVESINNRVSRGMHDAGASINQSQEAVIGVFWGGGLLGRGGGGGAGEWGGWAGSFTRDTRQVSGGLLVACACCAHVPGRA